MHSVVKSADSAVAGEKPNPRMPSSVGSMDRGTFEPQLSGAVDVFPIVKAVGTITQEITPRTGETSTPTEVSVSVPVSVPVPVPVAVAVAVAVAPASAVLRAEGMLEAESERFSEEMG